MAGGPGRSWWTGAADEIVPLAGIWTWTRMRSTPPRGRRARTRSIPATASSLKTRNSPAVIGAGIAWVGPPPARCVRSATRPRRGRLRPRSACRSCPATTATDQTDARAGQGGEADRLPRAASSRVPGAAARGCTSSSRRDVTPRTRSRERDARRSFVRRRPADPGAVRGRARATSRCSCSLDAHGNAVHLGERECSLQRRHQKVIEESPSPAVNAELRERLGEAALTLVRASRLPGRRHGRVPARPMTASFYFLEVNARLQVEHPVTEVVTGRDLVADQLAHRSR